MSSSPSDRSVGVSRRAFLGSVATAGLGAAALPMASAQLLPPTGRTDSFLDLLRTPDRVTAYCGLETAFSLSRSGAHWRARSMDVEIASDDAELPVRVSSPGDALTHLHLRWRESVTPSLLCMGDAWERSYGDLCWRCLVPERVMPWYFATNDGVTTHGYGVKTGAGAFCFWQIDPEGVSLWLDVSNGGRGVVLEERTLLAATIVARRGEAGENPVDAVRQLCKRMCAAPRPLPGPVYGSNDWYYAYGNSSQELILRDADLMASLRPAKAPKPFTVIDEGWANAAKFPDMARLAETIRGKDVRPGIWIRPLLASCTDDTDLLMPAARFGDRGGGTSELAFDPTVPDALALVLKKVQQIRQWGFELLKHDFSTYDLLGRWGFEMGALPTFSGWSFHDRSRTNAEIILDLYREIRTAAGDAMVILGCNTVGHLSAGIFEMQRTGDDNSGKIWERTRRMGVNTLAFRMPQHETFFAMDADCVAITKAIPWEMTRQWLDVVARSGTTLIVSPEKDATGQEQKKAVAEAFAIVTAQDASASAADWFRDTTPEVWLDGADKTEKRYSWCAPDGAYPFGV